MRNRIYMNDPPRPKDRITQDLFDRLDRLCGARPLDGTNLEWVYERDRKLDMHVFGSGDGSAPELVSMGLIDKR